MSDVSDILWTVWSVLSYILYPVWWLLSAVGLFLWVWVSWILIAAAIIIVLAVASPLIILFGFFAYGVIRHFFYFWWKSRKLFGWQEAYANYREKSATLNRWAWKGIRGAYWYFFQSDEAFPKKSDQKRVKHVEVEKTRWLPVPAWHKLDDELNRVFSIMLVVASIALYFSKQ